MCKLLKVSRRSYYKSLNQVESKRSIENKRLKEEILKIYNDNKKRYGVPKIHKTPINQGESINLKRVQSFMNDLGIKSIVCKKYKTYSSKNKVEERENILKRDFSTTVRNQANRLYYTVI
ncbi:IS3 family transposase [Clostridium thermarum]|uniref:IS3 family transposase n=1 Tax=Clostridium thermarum TaxID=1716543 RepID=UPI001123EA61|nr:IS3 family transposase [Clostridium thermarum]